MDSQTATRQRLLLARRAIAAAAAVLAAAALLPCSVAGAASAGAADESAEARTTDRSLRRDGAKRKAMRLQRARTDVRPGSASAGEAVSLRRADRDARGVARSSSGVEVRRGPRMSPALRSLADDARSLSPRIQGDQREGASSGMTRLEMTASPGRAGELLRRVVAAGGTPLLASGVRVRAEVPVAALEDVLAPGVVRTARIAGEDARVRRISPAGKRDSSKTGSVLSEGVALVGADAWLAADTATFGLTRSTPVRVAILDLGFEGYQDLIGTELAPDTSAMDFAPDWDVEGCFDGVPPCVPDGTAMAEIVADLAPSADLVLIAVDPFDFTGSLEPAIDFIVSGDGGAPAADILVSGLTWQPGLDGDAFGAGPLATFSTRVAEAGVTWINDVGDRDLLSLQLYPFVPAVAGHWHGSFEDTVDHRFGGSFDADGYMDRWFEEEDPAAGETWLSQFCLGPGDAMFLDLVWDDWDDPDENFFPAPTQDYTIDVFENPDELPIASSNVFPENLQSGFEGEYPWDFLDVVNNGSEAVCLFATVFAESATRANRFHLYWAVDDVSPFDDFDELRSLEEGNRLIPADMPSVVSVAATALDDQVEDFTLFGLPEENAPLVCAPDDVSTVALDGTFLSSFGAAHVAGSAALLMQKVSTLDTADALLVIDARARDILGAATDPRCGSGRLCLLTSDCPPGG